MIEKAIANNAQDLHLELQWLESVLSKRSELVTKGENGVIQVEQVPPPKVEGKKSQFAQLVTRLKMNFYERFIFIIALAPHVYPESLRSIPKPTASSGAYGGWIGKTHTGFLPTGETIMSILAGGNLELRMALHSYFQEDHFFAKEQLVWLDGTEKGEPQISGPLMVAEDTIRLLTTGKAGYPKFSHDFPSKRLQTEMEWDDLVLKPETITQLNSIQSWIIHQDTLMEQWGMKRKLKPGYTALFHGPPGTGKSLTAAVLGKQTEKEVFRIDLSRMVSKYIGETEKNLAKVFDRAENKNWILFFDEADALFGKRTNVNDSHDKYANQEVSYLLQRIEEYRGLVVLASNLKSNIDTAFIRRFQSIIHFPIPGPDQRLQLWQKGFSQAANIGSEVDLRKIAKDYEMAGGAIINVVAYSSLKAISRDSKDILLKDILSGIKYEFMKEGRMI